MMPLIKSFILFRQLCPNNCGVTVALIQLLFSYMPGDGFKESEVGLEFWTGEPQSPESNTNLSASSSCFCLRCLQVEVKGFASSWIYLVDSASQSHVLMLRVFLS